MPDTPVVDLDHLDGGQKYVNYHAARDVNLPAYERHRGEVRALCALASGGSLIEAGCGTGPHLPQFWDILGPKGRLVAFNASELMLTRARERLGEHQIPLSSPTNPGVHLHKGRLGGEFGNNFDVVLADRLIGHLPDPESGLRALGDLARPGGQVVVVNMLNAATTVNLGPTSSDRDLAMRILNWRAERGTTSPWAASVLPSLAANVNLTPGTAQCWTFTCRSLADTYPHSPLMDYGWHAHRDKAISRQDASRWVSSLKQRDVDGQFAATFTVRADVLWKRPV